jgi:phosphoribosylglycinamide formyltransferase 1
MTHRGQWHNYINAIVHYGSMALSLVVLSSGRGSNFKAILDAIDRGICDAKVLALISDNPDAPALQIARDAGVMAHYVGPKDFSTREEFDEAILALLESYKPDLVVLAGYMRIIKSPKLLSAYKKRIINIHPSLLPKYPGAHAQKDAFEAGEKISGLTIHYVDETLDGGKIICQEKVDISNCKNADEAAALILEHEHAAYPKIIDSLARKK